MSDVKSFLILTPPTNGVLAEDLIGSPCQCPNCHGSGWIMTYDKEHNESVQKECSFCRGHGMIVPTISIQWCAPIDTNIKYNTQVVKGEDIHKFLDYFEKITKKDKHCSTAIKSCSD